MLRLLARAPASVLRARAPVSRQQPLARFASTFFTKEHEWVKVDGAGAVCGVTDFAQSQLGDVVYVSLPEVGAKLVKG